MKTSYAIASFVLGFVAVIVGALFKVLHWFGADILLLMGLALEITAMVGFLYKAFRRAKDEESLNS